jgi:hypothetical protein
MIMEPFTEQESLIFGCASTRAKFTLGGHGECGHFLIDSICTDTGKSTSGIPGILRYVDADIDAKKPESIRKHCRATPLACRRHS